MFFSDGKTQDAVIRNIEIIGQAVKGTSDGTRALEPGVPWRQIAGMRDKLIHEYFGVDLALVWDVVENELPCCVPNSRSWPDGLRTRLAAWAPGHIDGCGLIVLSKQWWAGYLLTGGELCV